MSEKGRFSMNSILSQMDAINKAVPKIPEIPKSNFSGMDSKLQEIKPIDRRSRAEVREDFEGELAKLDKNALVSLKEKVVKLDKYNNEDTDELWRCKEDLENSLVKLIRYIDKFEELNSEESRTVALKEKELKLEGKHDWYDKFRLFFFRVLTSMLFVSTLFAIGYIEKEYDWATLPLSKYVKPAPPVSIN